MSYVYILSNPAMPGLVKIGFTNGDVPARARDLSGATGVPMPFYIEYILENDCPDIVEAAAHTALAAYRVNPGREFFRVSVPVATAAIIAVCDSYEVWSAGFTRIWNRGLPEWRERITLWIDIPIPSPAPQASGHEAPRGADRAGREAGGLPPLQLAAEAPNDPASAASFSEGR